MRSLDPPPLIPGHWSDEKGAITPFFVCKQVLFFRNLFIIIIITIYIYICVFILYLFYYFYIFIFVCVCVRALA